MVRVPPIAGGVGMEGPPAVTGFTVTGGGGAPGVPGLRPPPGFGTGAGAGAALS